MESRKPENKERRWCGAIARLQRCIICGQAERVNTVESPALRPVFSTTNRPKNFLRSCFPYSILLASTLPGQQSDSTAATMPPTIPPTTPPIGFQPLIRRPPNAPPATPSRMLRIGCFAALARARPRRPTLEGIA